jgi:type III restriction enzyme
VRLDPAKIPTEVELKAALLTNRGRPSLIGPGKIANVDLNPFRSGKRLQELAFDLARDVTRGYRGQPSCEAPAHVLFPQIVRIVQQYLEEKVEPVPPANVLDVFLSPYYGWVIEVVTHAIRPDVTQGEVPEVPRYESSRGAGSTGEVDFWTSREVREVIKSHLNYVVADTKQWEQSAAYHIDRHPQVESFAKNAGLGFAIPYFYNGQMHDYVPDFILRLKSEPARFLILETKGYDPLEDIKRAASERWVKAVNAEGTYGQWRYAVAKKISDIPQLLDNAFQEDGS